MLIGSWRDALAMLRNGLAHRVRSVIADGRWIAAVAWAAYQESRRRQ